MSKNVNVEIKKINNENRIKRAINICELDFFEVTQLDELDDTYVALEADIQYGSYLAFEKDGKVVLIKTLNDENGFGAEVLIPAEVTDEELMILTKKDHSNNNKLSKIMTFSSYISLSIIFLFFLIILIESFKTTFEFLSFLQIVITCLSPILLSLIALGVAKRIKK